MRPGDGHRVMSSSDAKPAADRDNTGRRVWIGRSVPRVEDAALLSGRASFVDDLPFPDALVACFVRSPVAHGLLRRINIDRARAAAGVHAVLTFADLRAVLTMDDIPLNLPAGGLRFDVNPTCLAIEEISYVGEPVAIVLAVSRHIAEDAAALVELEIEKLPAVVDPVEGLAPDAPRARVALADNLVAQTKVEYGDVEGAF